MNKQTTEVLESDGEAGKLQSEYSYIHAEAFKKHGNCLSALSYAKKKKRNGERNFLVQLSLEPIYMCIW